MAVHPDPAKARLGERLFRDARLSHHNRLACASCHQLDQGGDDGKAQSIGADGRPLDFNTPTVFNAALSFRLNWRGNFRSLEEQAEAVLLDPRLMGTNWPELLAKLGADQTYRDEFHAAYGQPPARPLVLDALAAFERSLVTPRAPFDRYLRGESDAIGPEEKRGYELFKSHGCVACHQGVNVGGNLFQRFGVFDDPAAGGPLSGGRPRPARPDGQGRGPLRVPRSEPAQRGRDGAVLPRWQGSDTRTGSGGNGAGPSLAGRLPGGRSTSSSGSCAR